MTKKRLPRTRGEDSPKSLIDLRILVLLMVACLVVWIALVQPAVAAAIVLGLTVLYLLHRLIER